MFNSKLDFFTFKSLLILSAVTLTVPVIQGCSEGAHPQDGDFTEVQTRASVKIAVRKPSDTQAHTLDALVFNDDPLQRIDCYQQMTWSGQESVLVGSCTGNKIVLLCANLGWDREVWRQYPSFPAASAARVNLEDEERDFPVMVGCTRMYAADESPIKLERLTSEVMLRSVCCDFSGKPYDGEQITDARVYLTNLNATCSLVSGEEAPMERIINHKGLIEEDLKTFKDSTLIIRNLGSFGSTRIYPCASLLCYPNTTSEESLGTPRTRLVIEGRIQGQTWYWPLDINRTVAERGGVDEGAGEVEQGVGEVEQGVGEVEQGIGRNCRYVFDVTITGKGTKDPDRPVTREMAETIFKIEEWKEKEEYSVEF
jgi:hypothetical protein